MSFDLKSMRDPDNYGVAQRGRAVPFGLHLQAQEIDSLRGIAAFLVFIFHAERVIGKNTEQLSGVFGYLQAFVVTGATGVTLFFILSGFLLSMPFFKNPNPDRVLFYKKRFIRIIPIYWLIVTVACVATGLIFNDPLKAIKSYLFLFEGRDMFPFSIPWWTLRTEIQFYLLLPLLMPLIHYRRGRWILISMIPLYILSMLFVFYMPNDGNWKLYSQIYAIFLQSVIRHAPVFIMGIIMSWVYLKYGQAIKEYLSSSNIFKNGLSDVIVICAFFLLSLVLRKVSLLGGTLVAEFNWPQRYIYESVPWCVIFMGVLLLPLRMKLALSNRFFAQFGKISYPFYFVHLPVLFYVSDNYSFRKKGWSLETMEIVALCFILAYIISYIINKFIETPLLRYKNNL